MTIEDPPPDHVRPSNKRRIDETRARAAGVTESELAAARDNYWVYESCNLPGKTEREFMLPGREPGWDAEIGRLITNAEARARHIDTGRRWRWGVTIAIIAILITVSIFIFNQCAQMR